MVALGLTGWNLWFSIICSVGFCVGFLLAVIRWAHNQLVNSVEERIGVVRAAVTPNSGSSMADAVARIEIELNRQGGELDRVALDVQHVSLKIERHLAFHEGRESVSRVS